MPDTCGLVRAESFSYLFGRSDGRALRIGSPSSQALGPGAEDRAELSIWNGRLKELSRLEEAIRQLLDTVVHFSSSFASLRSSSRSLVARSATMQQS
jgi:hypothetical protein